MNIAGQTKIIGVIGDPVGHSCSPQMHNAVIRDLGLDYVYIPFRVFADQLSFAINGFKALNVVGINVTLPHKKAILPMMDSISKEAELIGAVNTMVFKDGKVEGHNTDARGFIASVYEEGIKSIKDMNVVLLGAGGSARAIVTGLALDKVSNITIANRTLENAIKLAEEMNDKIGIPMRAISLDDERLAEYLSECDLFVSTITAGMDINSKPVINPDWLNGDCFVCDIVYTPPETNLLRVCKARGLKTINGIGMLVNQGAISFKLWTGFQPNLEIMRQALINALNLFE